MNRFLTFQRTNFREGNVYNEVDCCYIEYDQKDTGVSIPILIMMDRRHRMILTIPMAYLHKEIDPFGECRWRIPIADAFVTEYKLLDNSFAHKIWEVMQLSDKSYYDPHDSSSRTGLIFPKAMDITELDKAVSCVTKERMAYYHANRKKYHKGAEKFHSSRGIAGIKRKVG